MVLLFYALWLVQKTRAILSANQIQNQNQSPLRHTRFPALWAVCLLWLRILIGPLCNFPFRWLAAMTILVFILWHPIEKGSKPVTCLLMLTTGLKLPAHTTFIIFTLTIGSLILKLESKFDGNTLKQFIATVSSHRRRQFCKHGYHTMICDDCKVFFIFCYVSNGCANTR